MGEFDKYEIIQKIIRELQNTCDIFKGLIKSVQFNKNYYHFASIALS